MKANAKFRKDYAISEVVGGMLLVLVAVVAFAAMYIYLFPPEPDTTPNIKIAGYVTEDGFIVLKHEGGESLDSYKVEIRYVNNNSKVNPSEYRYIEDDWSIGEIKIPTVSTTLPTSDDEVRVLVFTKHNGKEEIIFDGILRGTIDYLPFELPMLFSSLLSNTNDEDLICHRYGITPQIDPISYIYNWSVNGNSLYNLLMPFDSENLTVSKDYSVDENNGTVNGAVWTNDSVIGGAYSFDGNDDNISLPYCFEVDNYIDEITVESWIKTTTDATSIASYGKEKFWDLGINNGLVRWSTNSDSSSIDAMGATNIIDGSWHYVAATYDSSSGDSNIYVDGVLDKNENAHNPGDELGYGLSSTGLLGESLGGTIGSSWDVLTYDDFESGWGNYQDGGRDSYLYNGGTYAHQGNRAAAIQDNSGQYSSFYYSSGVDVDSPGYTSIRIDFWFIASDVEWGEDFWVRYYDGNNWRTVADYDSGDEFVNDQFYHEIVWINETEYNFPSNMRIRFQCDASHNEDDIFFDEIYVNATAGGNEINNFDGEIDEFRIYNRALSAEQIYQNYLCMKDGLSDISVIVSEETNVAELWTCDIIPNDGIQDDSIFESNSLVIVNYGGG